MPDDTLSPIPLTDDQLLAVMRCAEPLPPSDRDRFLHRVAELLRGRPIGDGTVAIAARQAQAEVFKPPQMIHSPAPRPRLRHAR
jgi:hypothetical protein